MTSSKSFVLGVLAVGITLEMPMLTVNMDWHASGEWEMASPSTILRNFSARCSQPIVSVSGYRHMNSYGCREAIRSRGCLSDVLRAPAISLKSVLAD